MIRVGIIGFGVGEAHAVGYEKIAGCSVVALSDFNEERVKYARTKYPAISCYNNAYDLLSDPTIDAVSVASYDNYHYEHIKVGLQHGKHLFVEKPLVITSSQAEDVARLLRDKPDLVLSSNLILRKAPRFQELRQNIESGKLGRIYNYEADYNYGRFHKIVSGWRGREVGYSGIFGGGIHIVDLALWLLGVKVTSVRAVGSSIASEGSGFQNFDTILALLKFDNGAIGKIGVNLPSVTSHFHKMAIYGTKGTFMNNRKGYGEYVHDLDPIESSEKTLAAYPGAEKGDGLANFIRCIRGDADPEVSRQEIFDALSICLAIEASVHSGDVHEVNYYDLS